MRQIIIFVCKRRICVTQGQLRYSPNFPKRQQLQKKRCARHRCIRLMHESAIGGHDQWLPRCRSNIGIGNEIVGSFLLVLNSMALYAIWNKLCNLISE